MFATVFIAIFVATPLTLTLAGMFRMAGPDKEPDDPLPRWSMQDFKPRD
jgi:hypothetical protein